MNRVINAFGKLFSLTTRDAVSIFNDSMTIVETESDSTFNQMRIESPGDVFYVIEKDFYKDLFNGKSPIMGNVNCDGIALVRHEDKLYVLLIELKSNIDTTKLSNAFKQEIISFLKLNTFLTICDGYDISDFNIRGIIACHPFKKEDDKIKCLHDLLFEINTGKKDARLKYRMVTDQKISAQIENCAWFVPTDAFNEDIQKHEFTISLVYGNKYEDSSLTIPLKAII